MPSRYFTTFASILLLSVVLASGANAQDVKTILAAMPAATIQDEQAACAQLVKLGPAAIKEISASLAPLDGDDDTKARYALTALARYCGRPGAEPERMMLCKALCEAIPAAKDAEIKVFLAERLETVACDGAVPALTPLLNDDKLVAPAARALIVIGTPAAGKVITDALAAAPESRALSLVQAAGQLRAADAIPALEKHAISSNEPLRLTAIWALANLGAARTLSLIERCPKLTLFIESQLSRCSILLASRLAEAGDTKQAIVICSTIMQQRGRTSIERARISSALALCAKIGGESVIPTLVDAAQDGDIQIRAAALNAALTIPAPAATTKFVALLTNPSSSVKVDVLQYLARRGDKSATDAVLQATRDSDPVVRLAAAEALAKLNGDTAIDPLIALIGSGPADQTKPLAELIARMKGEKPMIALAKALNDVPAAIRPALIEVLAARPSPAGRDAVLAQTESTDAPVRLAAFKALEKLADASDVSRLVAMAMSATDPAQEAAAFRTANLAAISIAPETRADAFLAALSKAQAAKRAALLKAIGKAGGPGAMTALANEMKSTDPATKDAAVRALAESTDPAAIDPLLAVARDAATPAGQKVIAVRGAIQVTRNSTLASDAKVKRLAEAMALSQRPDEKRAILSALSTEHTPDALSLAAPLMEDGALKAEAALAVIRISAPSERGAKTLSGDATVAALKKAIPLCPDPRAKADGQKHLDRIDRKGR